MTYWNNNGTYQELVVKLQSMIPAMGEVNEPRKNKKLEKFRKAVNCYYDLYNNGLCNRAQSFAKVIGIPAGQYKYDEYSRRAYGSTFSKTLYTKTEAVMDEIILEAAREQGLV